MADEPKKTPESKPAAEAAGAKPAAPKPPAKEKPGPQPHEDDQIRRLRARFGDGIGETTIDRAQVIVMVKPSSLREVGEYLRDEEKYDFLSDLTAVDWLGQERSPRFDVVLNLTSIPHGTRLRLHVPLDGVETCPSVSAIWPTADWLERECYDMYGIGFEGHPNLTRILLPDDWSGHPLRKDYDILQQDERWVKENLQIESGQ